LAGPGGIFKEEKRKTTERRRGKNRIYQNKTARRGKQKEAGRN